MKIAGKHCTSLVDGFGVNYTLFTQGCEHHCEECQNPSTWSFDGGIEMSLDEIKKDILSYVPPVSGITFSGGDPVYQAKDVEKLAVWAKNHHLRTTLYTGFSIDEAKERIDVNLFDYIVDGRYEKDKRSFEAPFRGSSNQKMWKNTAGGFVEILG